MSHPVAVRVSIVVASLCLLAACGGGGAADDVLPDSLADGGDQPGDEAGDAAADDARADDGTAEVDASPEDSGDETIADAEEEADGDDVEDGGPEETTDDGGAGPAGCIEGTFQPYFGNLHSHTGNSDGEGSPSEAYAYARDVAGLDIMVVTDHLEQLYLGFGMYEGCLDDADAVYVPGSYVTLCGFEYGTGRAPSLIGSTGHNNVFFSPRRFPALQVDFHDFYASLVGCAECVGQYNHPGDSADEHWNHFEYFADVDERMSLFEFNSEGDAWGLFFQALDNGWHVSPAWDQDNHSANWGTANDHRSGFWLATLDRDSLKDAMLRNRSFSTADRNATIRMLAEGTCWMGSVLSGYPLLALEVVADDEDGEGFSAIELYGPAQTLLETHDCADSAPCTADFSRTVDEAGYVVARALQTDGDILIAGPIWYSP